MTDYHIYGSRRAGSARRHLGGEWDREAAERQVAEYRESGWVRLQIREEKVEGGRCIRSQTVRSPSGQWETVYFAEDVEEVAQSQQMARAVYSALRMRLAPAEAEAWLADWLGAIGLSRSLAQEIGRDGEAAWRKGGRGEPWVKPGRAVRGKT